MQIHLHELTSDEREVLDLYKGNSSHLGVLCFADYINECLRRGFPLDGPWDKVIRTFDSLFAKSALPDDTLLYRATVDDFVAPFVINHEFAYPAYMSTATDEYVVQRHFASASRGRPAALLRILCPAGTPALDLEMNPDFCGHEQEVLLPCRARFKVDRTQEIADRDEMASYMSAFYARNYSLLKIYELEYVGRV